MAARPGVAADAGKDKAAASQLQNASTDKLTTALDPSVIDPVGKLAQISNSVAQSSSQLTSISQDLDHLNDELARVERERPVKVTRAYLDGLEKRFKETIARSYVVEKRVKDSLAKSQSDIDNVHKVLSSIRAERAAGTGRKAVMTDSEIAECLKDLEDLRATIKALQQSLVDDHAKPNSKPSSKNKGHG